MASIFVDDTPAREVQSLLRFDVPRKISENDFTTDVRVTSYDWFEEADGSDGRYTCCHGPELPPEPQTSIATSPPLSSKKAPFSIVSPRMLAVLLGNTSSQDFDEAPEKQRKPLAEFDVVPKETTTAEDESGSIRPRQSPTGAEFFKMLDRASDREVTELALICDESSINHLDDSGRSALLIAAAEGHVSLCRTLLDRADFHGINHVDLIGSTALHFAAGNDHVSICEVLLASPRFESDLNTTNVHGKTSLDFAVEFGHSTTVAALKRIGGIAGHGASRRDARRSQHPGRRRSMGRTEHVDVGSWGIDISGDNVANGALEHLFDLGAPLDADKDMDELD
eukprot:TRINITY_DN59377_c0_g1_i1.p1 TRINITY_DN59377_c0_g1~~TRINITY_DN59377_c0_g1_i1.p1  ORF type:complete len:339 (-),score=50.41 TRINITY_DN59377_c0_g1_i1:102-1118(-)